MKQFDSNLHPIRLVPEWLEAVGSGWSAHFSRYTYEPQSLTDRRVLMSAPLSSITPNWLAEQLRLLGSQEELAIHSKLTKGDRVIHIPMVDFAVPTGSAGDVAPSIERHLGVSLQLFHSGRSFHGYGRQPVPNDEWVRLMGLMLLENLPGRAPVVDARWIGHRLVAGYSSLRWSRNTDRYLAWPALTPGLNRINTPA
jgi:hypothetical protein